MHRLGQSDLDELRGFLRSTTGYTDTDALRSALLTGLSDLVPCDLALYREVDLDTGAVTEWFIPPDAEGRADHEAEERRMRTHPVLRAHARGTAAALSLADLIDARALHRSALYDEVLHPLDIEWEIDLPIPVAGGSGKRTVAELSLTRIDQGFSERDRDLLDLARPGLVCALDDCHARERARDEHAHVLVLDECGDVIHATPGTGPILHEAFGLPDGGPSRLPAAVADWLALPPRPPLRARGVELRLLAGPPHVLLVETA